MYGSSEATECSLLHMNTETSRREEVDTHRYADYLLKTTCSKHNNYIVNKTLIFTSVSTNFLLDFGIVSRQCGIFVFFILSCIYYTINWLNFLLIIIRYLCKMTPYRKIISLFFPEITI